ncbi:MAG: diadenosine tetraphosphate hydrolase [Hyphomicrobiales bacterium]|nr:MAG: diadenosine tetraphosphate hydrolase [Hyphomicrobiales bacterium]
MSKFSLNPKIEKDSIPVMDLELSTVRLIRDANYPWLVMIPAKPDLVELIDLNRSDRHLLMDEISEISVILQKITKCHKLNVANLGNIVSQLHVHIIARHTTDPAWPGPVWGAINASTYTVEIQEQLIQSIKSEFKK